MVKILGIELFEPKKNKEVQEDLLPRVGLDASDYDEVKFHFPQLGLENLFDYAFYSDTLRTVTNSLERETFRNGVKLEKNFDSKCTNEICNAEFDYVIDKCPECGEPTRRPNHIQEIRFNQFAKCVNSNKQTLQEVIETVEADRNIFDNGYILILKIYTYANSHIQSAKISEIVRADPRYMEKIIDRKGRPGYELDSDKPVLVCPKHRHMSQDGTFCKEKNCGLRLYPAHFKTYRTNKSTYYLAGEVIHKAKFTKTIYYGFPPVLTLYNKLNILIAQDKVMQKYYTDKMSPRGLLTILTSNVESAKKAWEELVRKTSQNPGRLFPFFVQTNPEVSGANSQKPMDYMDLMKTPEEMQYLPVRQELVQKIGAFYGVSPIFQSDMSNAGGLNNEGLQITVTTRAVEMAQAGLQKYFDEIVKQLGITDYSYKFNTPEETDDMADLQRNAQEIQNASMMQQMGFEVWRTDDGKFEYSQKPTKPPIQTEETPLDFKLKLPQNKDQSAKPAEPTPSGAPKDITKSDDFFFKQGLSPVKKSIETEFESALTSAIEKFLGKPLNQDSLQKLARKSTHLLLNRFNQLTDRYLERAYNQQVEKLEKQFNINLPKTNQDSAVLQTLKNQRTLSQSYVGLQNDIVQQINNLIAKSVAQGQLSTFQLKQGIKEIADVSASKAETIARTEVAKIQAAAKKTSLEKTFPEGYKVRHAGPTDNRTTNVSKRIVARTKNGVSMDEYIRIMKEESAKDFPEWTVDENAPISHYNSRHRFEPVI